MKGKKALFAILTIALLAGNVQAMPCGIFFPCPPEPEGEYWGNIEYYWTRPLHNWWKVLPLQGHPWGDVQRCIIDYWTTWDCWPEPEEAMELWNGPLHDFWEYLPYDLKWRLAWLCDLYGVEYFRELLQSK